MTIRTTKQTVLFKHPFVIGGSDEKLPAGTYTIETDEELIEGISFPAYRRQSVLIHLLPDPDRPGLTQKLRVDNEELDSALIRDQALSTHPAESDTNA